MKNQYFGDNRDLFKYDLILQIIQAGLVNCFSFIPMLTPNMSDNEGARREGEARDRTKARAGYKNKGLKDFLDKFEDKSERDIKHLESFFGKHNVRMKIYYGKNKYFPHEHRGKHFEQVADKLLPRSLVSVDPDIGLQVKRSREKHILYKEVQYLYERMDIHSILMIFQFIPRINREIYFREISKKLKKEVGNLPIYISDNQVVFFFLTKDKTLQGSLEKVVSDYKKSYDKLAIPKFLR